MMRSLYSGISGLRNHQTRMDVIGNNISNVNTTGYKTSRVIFQDIFSQNVSSGMANQGFIGGTNPLQIGLGIRLSSVDVMHTPAPFARTDNPTDMMINGDGYFIVRGPDGPFYTRAGNFYIDNEGYLVNAQGFYVCGYSYEVTTGVIDPGSPEIPADPGPPPIPGQAAIPPKFGFVVKYRRRKSSIDQRSSGSVRMRLSILRLAPAYRYSASRSILWASPLRYHARLDIRGSTFQIGRFNRTPPCP